MVSFGFDILHEISYFLLFPSSLPTPQKFEGVLEPNERLTSAYKLFEGQLRGPESIVIDGGILKNFN